jgi:hypothetical protein
VAVKLRTCAAIKKRAAVKSPTCVTAKS